MNKPKTEKNVRANKLIKKLIGIAGLFVKSFYFEGACLVVQVRPVWRIPRCSHCGRICSGYDHKADPVCWVHLEIGTTRFIIKYAPRRVECPCCGVRVELVPWARPGSRFTRPFEEKTAYLAQITNKTEVSKLMGIAWRTVGNIIQRVVNDKLDPKRLDGLSRIGIDEISFRKNHRYITTVVDHATRRIVWAAEGKSSETLNKFFEELGEERAKKISIITIDMSAAFIKSIEEKVPHAQIIFDLFHVLKLSSEAVDKVRRKLISGLKERDDSENASAIKKSRYVLLKNPWDLTSKEWGKLCSIQQHNAGLYRAYLLKESLAAVFLETSKKAAERELDRWIAWASRSKLKPFIKVARTIKKYKDGILAYIETRLTNGLVEGLNNKLRMINRRAFGFHSADAVISMLFLCCGGIETNPPLPSSWCNW